MIVYFVRHGESTANTLRVFSNRCLDHPLTERGRLQVNELSTQVSKMGITGIYSSPVPRAVETAQIISWSLGVGFQIADGLREFDVGILEGRSDPLAHEIFDRLWKNWFEDEVFNESIQDGEQFSEIIARFNGFIQEISKKYQQQDARILCISHGGLLSAVLPRILENIDYKFVRANPLGETALVVTENMSGKWFCRQWDGVSFT